MDCALFSMTEPCGAPAAALLDQTLSLQPGPVELLHFVPVFELSPHGASTAGAPAAEEPFARWRVPATTTTHLHLH